MVAFAFKENLSSKVLKKLKVYKKYYVASNKDSIINFLKKLIEEKPNYILGLGMYSGKDKNKLRIETHCSRGKIKYPINHFLTPSKNAKYANGIGNSYCNFASYEIMKAINKKMLKSEYAFVHIPKTFQASKALLEIKEMLAQSI